MSDAVSVASDQMRRYNHKLRAIYLHIVKALLGQDKRVVWDARVKLLTSQGPGTAIDFGLKIIDLLVGREKAHEVASQLVMAAGIYNYYE